MEKYYSVILMLVGWGIWGLSDWIKDRYKLEVKPYVALQVVAIVTVLIGAIFL